MRMAYHGQAFARSHVSRADVCQVHEVHGLADHGAINPSPPLLLRVDEGHQSPGTPGSATPSSPPPARSYSPAVASLQRSSPACARSHSCWRRLPASLPQGAVPAQRPLSALTPWGRAGGARGTCSGWPRWQRGTWEADRGGEKDLSTSHSSVGDTRWWCQGQGGQDRSLADSWDSQVMWQSGETEARCGKELRVWRGKNRSPAPPPPKPTLQLSEQRPTGITKEPGGAAPWPAEICPLCPPPAQDARGDAAGGYGEPLKIPAPERGSYKYPQPFRKGAGG